MDYNSYSILGFYGRFKMTEVFKDKRRRHANKKAYEEHKRFCAKEKRRILKDLTDTGLEYRTLQKAASEYKLTPDFLWEKILKGKKFTSMKMKVKV
tara:strand:+ start:239 stop:526 length:288 start_codon:yes stop_codon:yes gene_type:complete